MPPAQCRPRRSAGRAAAVLIALAALGACQADPPAVVGPASECRSGGAAGCRLAGFHTPHWRVAHRHHVKAALRRHAPSASRRDVEAIMEGMRRARAEPRPAASPADLSP